MNVAILGASDNVNRFSNKAMVALLNAGHSVFLVHPKLKQIESHPVYETLSAIPKPIHTLTVYVNESLSTALMDDIVALHPARVIFNPGTENRSLIEHLSTKGIVCVEHCTLVMLREGLF